MKDIINESIDTMVAAITAILGDKISLYLTGSVVLDDFAYGWSDIDILCLTQTDLTEVQENKLLNLRQTLVQQHKNVYMRMFEGAILPKSAFIGGEPATVVYWGTSGEKITDHYDFNAFDKALLHTKAKILFGEDVRYDMNLPKKSEYIDDCRYVLSAIRKYALHTDDSLYSCGWLFDIARCLYTLDTYEVTSKTDAMVYAVSKGYMTDTDTAFTALELRQSPLSHKDNNDTKLWLAGLGDKIQQYANVLEERIEKAAKDLEKSTVKKTYKPKTPITK